MELSKISNIIKLKKILFTKKNTRLDFFNNYIKKFPNIEIIRIKYKSDGLSIDGFIYQKKKIKKKLPVIIFCRGGNNKHGTKFKSGEIIKFGEIFSSKIYDMGELRNLVNNGEIIVFASNYRESSRSEGLDEFGGRDVNDVKNLYPIIKKYKYSDQNKIAVYGHSRGCMMALILHQQVKWIKTLIIFAGAVDLIKHIKFRPDMGKMLKTQYKLSKKDLEKRSAINFINKFSKNVPILILHGNSDERVEVDQAYLLGQSLQKNNIPYKLIIYPGGCHSLRNCRSEVCYEISEWLQKYLL